MSDEERWTARRDRWAWALGCFVTGVMMGPQLDDLAHALGLPMYLVVGVPVVLLAGCVGLVEGWSRADE